MKVTLNSYQKINLFKILNYSSYLLEQQKIPHNTFIYQFVDKKHRIYRSNNIESIDRFIHILNPFEGPYTIPLEGGTTIEIQLDLLDKDHLYPYLDKDVFEIAFRLDMIGETLELIEKFIKEALQYAHKNFENDSGHKNLYIYTYNETSENWDKYGEVNQRMIETIYLPAEQSKAVLKDVDRFLSPETRENYSRFGIPYHKTYCFYGPPGTGKTSLIHAICSNIQRHICIYRFSPQTKDQDVASALKWIPKNSVFVLEDIDCILKNREEVKGSITFSGLLNLLDGLSGLDCLLTFITTNHFLELDRAIKRPGRIDYILEFTFIGKEQIYKMMEVFYPNEKADFDYIYGELKNYKMTVCHFQKFLFSLYPEGKIRSNVRSYIQEFLKYYTYSENKLYI